MAVSAPCGPGRLLPSSTLSLRVLYVSPISTHSGATSSLRFLLQHLPPGTVEPFVLCPPGDTVAGFEAAGAAIITIPGISMFLSTVGVPLRGRRLLTLLREVFHLRHGPAIARALRSVRPDLVHLNERGMFQVARAARQQGIPVVMHARGVADRETRWVHKLFARWTTRYVDRVIAIDESVRWSLREIPQCEVVYNPLDLAAIADATRAAAPRTEPGPVRVTFMNTLLAYKGVWDLLEAARLLRDRTDIVFHVAGGNSRSRKFLESPAGRLVRATGLAVDMEQRIAEWITREGLEGSVRLLGHVNRPMEVLATTDILVFPSHLNGLGRSVFEAGAMGVPSIVTLRDRMQDIVEDGVTGLVLPERDPSALADAIRRMADDPAGRREMGLRAREKYLTQFDPVPIGRQLVALYKSLLPASLPGG